MCGIINKCSSSIQWQISSHVGKLILLKKIVSRSGQRDIHHQAANIEQAVLKNSKDLIATWLIVAYIFN